MKIRIGLSCFSFAFIMLGAAMFVNNYRADRNFYCAAQDTLYHGDMTIKGNYGFAFHGSKGFLIIDARIEHKGAPAGNVRRTIDFTFKIREGNYVLQSNKITTLPVDNADTNGFQHHAPSFFVVNNQTLVLFITNDDNHGKVIFFGHTPAFYCNQTT
ncbi:hypothetical protein [Serratia fonticola]|uniref:hypothetical protein n=1 Tax=Serratia fonticola TaxID=47917 RepID=UPI00192B84F2|nr:hypothetical protein [Serratia fonticola]MBL5828032.1 hypothetical protein [Serratia fonticola]MBL5903127.1 hypothetical protein [Serratia fonticola]MDK2375747.1 hypothetical protein [Serratia fonticola]